MAYIYHTNCGTIKPRAPRPLLTKEGERMITALLIITLACGIARAAFADTIIGLAGIAGAVSADSKNAA